MSRCLCLSAPFSLSAAPDLSSPGPLKQGSTGLTLTPDLGGVLLSPLEQKKRHHFVASPPNSDLFLFFTDG